MSVERWGTVSDVITAFAAVVIAFIGGLWAWFRYRREDPDLPRVNSSITLQSVNVAGVDYVSWAARVEHVAGAALTILHEPGSGPTVSVLGYSRANETGPVPETPLDEQQLFPTDTQVAASEYIVNDGTVAVATPGQFVGYHASFTFCGEWSNG